MLGGLACMTAALSRQQGQFDQGHVLDAKVARKTPGDGRAHTDRGEAERSTKQLWHAHGFAAR